MIELRLVKIVMTGSMALLTFLVTFGNVTDYGSNFTFVQHVLSMDTTFPGNNLDWRAITNPAAWHVAYWVIILGEAVTCVAYTIGTAMLMRDLSTHGTVF